MYLAIGWINWNERLPTTGILVTRVIGVKKNCDSGKQFMVVDAAMNDLIRPSFYQAYHHVLPVRQSIPAVTVPSYAWLVYWKGSLMVE